MTAISPANYGMMMRLPLTTNYPHLFFGQSRLWDVQVTDGVSALHWNDIETSAGVYDWTNLDSVVNYLRGKGLVLNYTFGYVPSFYNGSAGFAVPPTAPQNFYNFATALFTRYAGKIKYYELWNEVQSGTTYWSGTNAQLLAYAVALKPILTGIDSNAVLLTPSVTSLPGPAAMDALLALGIGTYCPEMAIHGYAWVGLNNSGTFGNNQPPEQSDNIVKTYNAMRDFYAPTMPIHYTEYSWNQNTSLNSNPILQGIFSALQQVFFLGNGVADIQHYRYDANSAGTLYDSSAPIYLNVQGRYARAMQSWLMGATLSAPVRTAGANGVRNTTFTGMVAGTPGTAGTNQALSQPDSGFGITTSLSNPTTENAIACFDLSISGTSTAGASGAVEYSFETTTQIAALPGQTWNIGAAVKLQSGSMSGIARLSLNINQYTAGGAFISTALQYQFTAFGYGLGNPTQSYLVTLPTATGTLTWVSNPSNGETITLNGTVWTFTSGTASGNQTKIKGSLSATLTQLVSDLGASTDANLAVGGYTATGTVLTITCRTSAGTAFTLAASVATPSGATVTALTTAFIRPSLRATYTVGTPTGNPVFRIGNPSLDSGNQWAAALTRPSALGQPTAGTIAWDQSGGPSNYTPPGGTTWVRDLNGNSFTVPTQSVLTNSPQIFENGQSIGL